MTADEALSLRIVEGAEAARASVLRRDAAGASDLPEPIRASIRDTFGADLSAEEVVARIIEDVRREGDAAVRRYSQRFDGSADAPMEVGPEEFEAAFEEAEHDLIESMRYAAERVRVFHELQLEHGPRSFLYEGLGQEVLPIQRAGIYMTGSVAVLPSSVLHTARPYRTLLHKSQRRIDALASIHRPRPPHGAMRRSAPALGGAGSKSEGRFAPLGFRAAARWR